MSDFKNKADNSDVLPVESDADRFLATQTGKMSEIQKLKEYYEYLKLRAELQGDIGNTPIQVDGINIPIKSLIAKSSEFEDTRLKIIALVNSLGVDHPQIRQLMDSFETDSVFTMASEYANYLLAETRKQKLYSLVNGKYGQDNKSIFNSVAGIAGDNNTVGADYGSQSDALTALRTGNVSYGLKASRAK